MDDEDPCTPASDTTGANSIRDRRSSYIYTTNNTFRKKKLSHLIHLIASFPETITCSCTSSGIQARSFTFARRAATMRLLSSNTTHVHNDDDVDVAASTGTVRLRRLGKGVLGATLGSRVLCPLRCRLNKHRQLRHRHQHQHQDWH